MTVFFALPRSSVVTLLLPFPFVKVTKNLLKKIFIFVYFTNCIFVCFVV